MNDRVLVVNSVVRAPTGRVALQVASPQAVDLQYIYRAALSIYWNPAEAMLEDRSEFAASAEESADRITSALRGEYGMSLRPSEKMRWQGFGDGERDRVSTVLFGTAR